MTTGTSEHGTSEQTRQRTRLVGGLLMWFAVLGGFLAWAAHLIAAWSTDELTCAADGESVSGTPLSTVLSLMVVIPAVVTLAALLVSAIAWRRVSRARREAEQGGHVDRRLERAGLMAMIGVWANLLFFAIIVFGGVALLVYRPCQF